MTSAGSAPRAVGANLAHRWERRHVHDAHVAPFHARISGELHCDGATDGSLETREGIRSDDDLVVVACLCTTQERRGESPFATDAARLGIACPSISRIVFVKPVAATNVPRIAERCRELGLGLVAVLVDDEEIGVETLAGGVCERLRAAATAARHWYEAIARAEAD